jgi:hypothetical protein
MDNHHHTIDSWIERLHWKSDKKISYKTAALLYTTRQTRIKKAALAVRQQKQPTGSSTSRKKSKKAPPRGLPKTKKVKKVKVDKPRLVVPPKLRRLAKWSWNPNTPKDSYQALVDM